MSNPSEAQSLRPIEFQILLVLADGDSHGYGIIREIEDHCRGQLVLEPGTLYRALRRLAGQGLVRESEARPAPETDDRRRRYFAITERGREAASAEAVRLDRLLRKARAGGLIPETAE